MHANSGEESGLIPNKDKDCKDCANYLGNGICQGNSKNEMVDRTGEQKCFEQREEK